MASKLVAQILAEKGYLDTMARNSALSRSLRDRGVIRSQEFLRVKALPRRAMDVLEDESAGEELAEVVSRLLFEANGGTGQSPLPLRPLQAAMLVDAADHGGLLISLDVGAGKSWAAPLFVTDRVPAGREGMWPQIQCERPVMLLPPSVKAEMTGTVIPTLKKIYRIHPNLKLVAYSELQTVRGANILNELRPDVLIVDEAHNLKNLTSARARRVKSYMKENPKTKVVGMTGTLSDKSLRDFWHILLWTHPHDAPLPRSWKELEDWANAVDAGVDPVERMPPGALLELCEGNESAREGLQRRMSETSGFMLAQIESIKTPLVITARRDVSAPQSVQDALTLLDDAWVTPDNEPVPDGARWAQRMRELSLGFYYVWDWSKVTKDGRPDMDWLRARSAWNQLVRDICRRGNTELDSELRIRNAVRAQSLPKSVQSMATATLAAWDEQRTKPEPETKPVWLSDFAMEWASGWMLQAEHQGHPGLVWCEHDAVLTWFAKRGVPVYGGGTSEELIRFSKSTHAGKGSIVLSRPSHYQGKNMQAWHNNLVLTPPPNGKIWQQMLGRTHRAKQLAPEVRCDFMAHTDISFRSVAEAVKRARYSFETFKAPQKILSCVAQGWSI